MLDVVEWSGALAIAVALVAFGYAWGRWRALAALAVVWVVSRPLSTDFIIAPDGTVVDE